MRYSAVEKILVHDDSGLKKHWYVTKVPTNLMIPRHSNVCTSDHVTLYHKRRPVHRQECIVFLPKPGWSCPSRFVAYVDFAAIDKCRNDHLNARHIKRQKVSEKQRLPMEPFLVSILISMAQKEARCSSRHKTCSVHNTYLESPHILNTTKCL